MSSSVPKIASPDEDVVVGDGVMDLVKPEEVVSGEEVACGGSIKRPKPEEEVEGDGAMKRLKPEEEVAERFNVAAMRYGDTIPRRLTEVPYGGLIQRAEYMYCGGAFQRPKPEEEIQRFNLAEMLSGGTIPLKPAEVPSGCSIQRAKPEEVVVDGAIHRVKPVEVPAGKGLAFGVLKRYTPDEARDGAIRSFLSRQDLAELRFNNFKFQAKMLRTGAKLEKKVIRVGQAAMERVLQDPPHDTDFEPPEDFDLVPEPFRSAFLRNTARAKKLVDEHQNIIDQYHSKGYAEIEKFVFVDKDGKEIQD